jgi:hypothetical protein
MLEQIKGHVKDAELILVGIGEEFSIEKEGREHVLEAYNHLADMLRGKGYFIVTLQTDDLIYESHLAKERIVAPCGSVTAGNVVTNENYDESIYLPQWEVYTKWLQNTLNHKLCVLELGVGFQYPSVIRFPFEKVVYFNQKAKLIRVHSKFAQLTPEISERGVSVGESPVRILNSEGEKP